MNKCAFTICTKSYVGLSIVLKNSFLKYHNDFEFYIFVVDEENDQIIVDDKNTDKVINAKKICNISNDKYIEMAFKYDVTEFCTSLKPFCFEYLFSRKNEIVFYLDPDIYFFSRMDDILNSDQSIYLTPHITTINCDYDSINMDIDFLRSGIYNCGFIGIKNDVVGRNIVEWWKNRLFDNAFNDPEWGLFTDQKWVDFIPALIDSKKLYIIRNKGYNLAPWNFFERQIVSSDSCYYVKSRVSNENDQYKLIFVHFSGFDYKNVTSDGNFEHKYRKIDSFNDLNPLYRMYAVNLVNNSYQEYFNIKYLYDSFSNGDVITFYLRRIYRSCIDNSLKLNNPFLIENSFYKAAKKSGFIQNSQSLSNSRLKNVSNLGKKQKLIEVMYKLIYNFLGLNNYQAFLRATLFYSRIENSVFLLKTDTENAILLNKRSRFS